MASMRFGTLQLCDEHACKSATKTSTEVAHFYAATWTHFTLRLTKAKYHELIAKGKCRKLAITAVMRKLVVMANALLRDSRKWTETRT